MDHRHDWAQQTSAQGGQSVDSKLDIVHEHRQLSEQEIIFKRDLKARFLGMTAVEKLRARQKSRLNSIRAEPLRRPTQSYFICRLMGEGARIQLTRFRPQKECATHTAAWQMKIFSTSVHILRGQILEILHLIGRRLL